MAIITLITDFGPQDHYVGQIKGVIAGISPEARVIDVTHEVGPHNVYHGAFVLQQIWPWYPRGTIHVAVVDPGVGSDRRILLGLYAGQFVIAPDNGLVTLLHRAVPPEAMYVVENRRYFTSHLWPTFHGRDVMAPVAAHLAGGVKPQEFGRATDHLEMLPVAYRAELIGGTLHGLVQYVDRFGTLVTNISHEQVAGLPGDVQEREVVVAGTLIGPIRSTYSDVAPGEPVALIGSSGLLEIAVNQGRAVNRFGAVGKKVEVLIR